VTVSIVMTAYKRHNQLKNTLISIRSQTRQPDQIVVVEDGDNGSNTRNVCEAAKLSGLPVEYYLRKNRPNKGYSNPAIPKNISLQKATGDILVIQCAEVMYTKPADLANLVAAVEEAPLVSACATVKAFKENGDFERWLAGPERKADWFLDFCCAYRRADVMSIGGFDEGYTGYGFDDDDFAFRLRAIGVKTQWAAEVLCHHQYHGYDGPPLMDDVSHAKYDTMVADVEAGRRTPVANIGRVWGDLNS
jgi:GT2 family glycosyltransferase